MTSADHPRRGRDEAATGQEPVNGWDAWYRERIPPWDIGRPQPAVVRLADAGELVGPVLDCGCGTGEHTILLAERGIEALGVDIAPAALEIARGKAAARGVEIDVAVADALELGRLGRRFRTVLDSALFHALGDEERPRYIAGLADVVEPGGVVHVLCFSDRTPGAEGPRRISQAELRLAFADGWTVERIDPEVYEARDDFAIPRAHAWLARIVRSAAG